MTQTLKPYADMVRTLFKTKNYHSAAEPLVHAAIGIIGEVVELQNTTGIENTIEESGDLEFYVEAAVQSLYAMPAFVPALEIGIRDIVNMQVKTITIDRQQIVFPSVTMHDMLTAAADLLDLSKKLWIYGKPLDEDMTVAISIHIGKVLGNLRQSYLHNGLTEEGVRTANQRKLGKRYPEGVFTEQHAQSRLDKVEFAPAADTEGGTND